MESASRVRFCFVKIIIRICYTVICQLVNLVLWIIYLKRVCRSVESANSAFEMAASKSWLIKVVRYNLSGK